MERIFQVRQFTALVLICPLFEYFFVKILDFISMEKEVKAHYSLFLLSLYIVHNFNIILVHIICLYALFPNCCGALVGRITWYLFPEV
jgi:hypothetical protein